MSVGAIFAEEVTKSGFDFFTGVPCSYLTPVINSVMTTSAHRYVGATSEGEAVAIASGAQLAGRKAVVMCQNSGLGNAVNPLTSLSHPFRLPILFVTTWRGEPGRPDEPQHEVMGAITPDLITLIGFEQLILPEARPELAAALKHASDRMDITRLPFCLVMRGTDEKPAPFPAGDHIARPTAAVHRFGGDNVRPSRSEVLRRVIEIAPHDAAMIASTGKCGRELYTISDRANHLYQVGSMGCAAGMALGVALNVSRSVFVLDGDGALLMKMGTLATIGAYRPNNLVHVLLDNGVHDSTGGQPTVSAHIDFALVAAACGYRYVASCDTLEHFEDAVAAAAAQAGPSFIHIRIKPGSMAELGRPSISPAAVAARFCEFLRSGTAAF